MAGFPRLPQLRVTRHAEGAVKDVVVKVHGATVKFEDNVGEADPGSSPSFVQFSFAAGPAATPGVRFRVEIRGESSSILYREEVQLPPNGGSYDSGLRYFAV